MPTVKSTMTAWGLEMLTERDHEIIRQCLRAAADGPFFPDWDFHTLFGFDRTYFRTLAHSYAAAEDVPVHLGIAVHNSLNNLLGCPTDRPGDLPAWVNASPQEIEQTLNAWRSTYGYT
jgi:hypothetical protein